MLHKVIYWSFISFIGLTAIGLSAFFYISSNLPSVEEINNRQIVESTKIYDRTGEVVLYEVHGEEKRTIVPYSDMPQSIKDATISAEDNSFYENPAFDIKGILRAIYVNITRRQVLQGGSTITQQLAKKAFLTDDRTLIRKFKELILAFRLEKRYTKDQILEFYLNQIPYGANIYGIGAASQAFFNKKTNDLTIAESALLAALPKAPSYYSPWGYHVDELMKRKDFVLKRMNELGHISNKEYQDALSEELRFAERARTTIKAPHFVFHIQDYLNKKYGKDFVMTSGLKVYTTLDWDLQQIAEGAVKRGVERNTKLYKGTNGALVASDPKTGQILAMVGSADYFDIENEGNYNVAVQGLRQPGSTFKPFVYMTAFEKGFTPDTIIWDVPTEFDTTKDPERSYSPRNNDGIFRGPVTMKEALATSLNIPAVKTLYLAGIKRSLDNAELFGISTLKDRERYGLSLVLGGGEVTLNELVNAYGVFATEGTKNPPASILRIEDSEGNILEEYENKSEEVVDPNYPRLINDILSDVELRSGLFKHSLYLTQVPGYQIALKTGTTNDFVDAWTVGYTPNLVVGVWAGNNHREPFQSQAGSVLAALPMWHDFTSKALALNKFPVETFTSPTPLPADKPVLRGELAYGEFHEILYYLNRTNDSQFENWETGVSEWVALNPVNFSRFAGPEPSAGQANVSGALQDSTLNLNILSPQNGSTANGPIGVQVEALSGVPIRQFEVYFNGAPVENRSGDLGSSFVYSSTITPQALQPQNLLSVRATNAAGVSSIKEIIIFTQF